MTKRILVIDDHDRTREMFATALRHRGFIVDAAADAIEAAGFTAIERPDLIVLDVIMPAINGLELSRTFRADPKLDGVPIILASGTYLTADDLKESGATTYLMKPFMLAELVNTAEELIGKPQD